MLDIIGLLCGCLLLLPTIELAGWYSIKARDTNRRFLLITGQSRQPCPKRSLCLALSRVVRLYLDKTFAAP
ncbi:hypothetical protein J3E68DRAFT_406760 [Trichoderma sp. SZMC 28012]